jgi:hypothetical protein
LDFIPLALAENNLSKSPQGKDKYDEGTKTTERKRRPTQKVLITFFKFRSLTPVKGIRVLGLGFRVQG